MQNNYFSSDSDQKDSNKNSERAGSVCIVLSAVLFGIMPFLARVACSQGSNAFSVAFGRFLFGALILMVIIFLMPDCSIRISRKALAEIIKISVFYAVVPILLYCSYDYIDSGLATTLHFTYPVAVILILALFYKTRMDPRQILCTILCVIGIFLLYSPNGEISLWGIFLAVLSGILYAVYIVQLGKSSVKELSPLVLSFWLSLFSVIEIGLIALAFGKLTFDITPAGWGAEFLLAILTTVLALVLFQKGLVLCGEVKASLLSTFEPLTGIIIGVLAFQEVITGRQCIGIIGILAAALILVLPFSRLNRKDSASACQIEQAKGDHNEI